MRPEGLTDDELVGAARSGDRAAMDTLLRRHQDRLWAVCRRLTGSDADAADALQETMVLLVRRLDTFDGRARFTTWAHRVATNACLDELRRRNRRPSPGLPDDDPDGPASSGRETVDRATPVDQLVTDRMALDGALGELPDDFRVPLVLRDLGGHDYAEISRILDLPPGTVRSRIARARRRLADLLEPGNQPPAPRRPSPRP